VIVSIQNRVRLAFAAVLLLGAALSAFVYLNGRAVREVSEPLLHQQLPLLETLSRLQLEVAEQEPILYEYYATTERPAFQQRFGENDSAIQRDLDSLARVLGEEGSLAGVRAQYARLQELAGALDETLRVYGTKSVDWDRAREVLVDVSKAGRTVNGELGAVAASVRDAVSRGGAQTRARVDSVISAVLAFSILIGIVAAFVGYYVTAYLVEAGERQKLAMFVEKNPNPVLRLTIDGEVVYANPGVAEMLRMAGRPGGRPGSVLPSDIGERLNRLAHGTRQADWFEYEIFDRTLQCVLRYLPAHGVFHCYLADITERKRAEARMRHQAFHDALTGLPNRRLLQESIAGLAPAQPAAVMQVNFDRFRQLLTDVGLEVGDELLQHVAARLAQFLPPEASPPCLYRLEGDTFALLVSAPEPKETGEKLARQLREVLEKPFHVEGRELFLSASAGISLFPKHGRDAAALMRNAGAALHAVKQAGGDSYLVYNEEMTAEASERLALEGDLRRALEREELFLHYQPQVELLGGRIIRGEVLLRWSRRELGGVSPGRFIPVAEETGLIMPIGEWVLRQACRRAMEWRQQGFAHAGLAVNISAVQFQRPGLVELVCDVLSETGLEPHALELEITESSAMHDVERTVRVLQELKGLGVAIAIDDFGTGFSSLSYLSRFPLDRLKIDQSFVRGLGQDPNAAAIASAVVTLGHSMGLRVIAEGVETPEQLCALREMGCDEIQGYLFSKPLPHEHFVACLREGRRLVPERGEQGPFYGQPGLSQVV
jgi:diguanylate cyclase (GGDEF)-like protein